MDLHYHAVEPQRHPLHYQPQTADCASEEQQQKADTIHHVPERNKFKEIPIPEKVPTLVEDVEKEDDSRSEFALIKSWTTFTGPDSPEIAKVKSVIRPSAVSAENLPGSEAMAGVRGGFQKTIEQSPQSPQPHPSYCQTQHIHHADEKALGSPTPSPLHACLVKCVTAAGQ